MLTQAVTHCAPQQHSKATVGLYAPTQGILICCDPLAHGDPSICSATLALQIENENRVKTTEQRIREGEAWKAVESERSKARQVQSAQTTNALLGRAGQTVVVNLPQPSEGKTHDKVAEKVGMKGSTFERGAKVVDDTSEAELFALAIQRNSAHGLQMNDQDKRASAIRLYAAATGLSKEQIANVLSVSLRSVSNFLTDVDKQLREARKAKIFDMWMACASHEEIAEAVKLDHSTITRETKELCNLEAFPKSTIVSANFADDYTPPLYNVWTFSKKTNEVAHFGNSEQRIVDNLLYLYTQPFDIVVDPFAGGDSTIDVCKRRLRRYWVSDRKPIVERENEIRLLDVAAEAPPLNFCLVTQHQPGRCLLQSTCRRQAPIARDAPPSAEAWGATVQRIRRIPSAT